MKKILFVLCLGLIFAGCDSSESQKISLSEEAAKDLVEKTLLSLEDYPENGYEKYFNDAFLKSADFNKLLPILINEWNLNNPSQVKVAEVKNGTAQKNNQRIAQVVGTLQCEGSDHVSDFYFTFTYNESNEKWGIIDFKFEGC